MNNWRLIVHGAGPGAWNMAVDEALLESAARQSQPSLRFYRWSRPTLSLGYFQRYADRTLHPASHPCDVVRRASGGAAIVHDHDLTYSLALPCGDRWSSQATCLYHEVHTALVSALAEWGVDAYLRSGDTAGRRQTSFLCFVRQVPGDAITHGAKIAGSAQRRRRQAVLQHGSVLFRRSPFAPELPGIEELAGLKVDRFELMRGWASTLARRLNLALAPDHLLADEAARAKQLAEQRFGSECWTYRR